MALSSLGVWVSTELRLYTELMEATGLLSSSPIEASLKASAVWLPRCTWSQQFSSSFQIFWFLSTSSTFKRGPSKRGLILRPLTEDFLLLRGRAGGWGEGRVASPTESPSLSRTESARAFSALHSLSARWVNAALCACSALCMSTILDSLVKPSWLSSVHGLPVSCGKWTVKIVDLVWQSSWQDIFFDYSVHVNEKLSDMISKKVGD